ncbi:MAG: hypothetical protein GY906_38955 [bacterium]|nr:hypothetical protein [bacterium]
MSTRQHVDRAQILMAAADAYDVDAVDIIGNRKSDLIAKARRLAAYLMREINGWSYPDIGRRLGSKDHTMPLHGINRLKEDEQELRVATELCGQLVRGDVIYAIDKQIRSGRIDRADDGGVEGGECAASGSPETTPSQQQEASRGGGSPEIGTEAQETGAGERKGVRIKIPQKHGRADRSPE